LFDFEAVDPLPDRVDEPEPEPDFDLVVLAATAVFERVDAEEPSLARVRVEEEEATAGFGLLEEEEDDEEEFAAIVRVRDGGWFGSGRVAPRATEPVAIGIASGGGPASAREIFCASRSGSASTT